MKQFLTGRSLPLLVLAGLILIAGLIWIIQDDKERNWRPTWSVKDREPFGTELFVELLKDRFAPLPVEISKQSPLGLWAEETPVGEVFLVVNEAFDPNFGEWEALSDFVRAGNTLLVAASSIGPTAGLDLELGLDPTTSQPAFSRKQDSLEITFTSKTLPARTYIWPAKDVSQLRWWGQEEEEEYLLEEDYLDWEEEAPAFLDSILAEAPPLEEKDDEDEHTLMVSNWEHVVVLRLDWGRGTIIFCSLPKAFTNYGVLTDGYEGMASGILSYLPEQPTKVWWDEWIKTGNRRREPDEGAEGPGALAFIWEREALRMALILAVVALLLLGLFQTRRVQAIIPVRPPLPNLTLDFADTVGRLYFRNSNHRQLALKRVVVLREHIQEKYLLPETWGSQAFVRMLAAKSGHDEALILSIVQTVARIEQSDSIDEMELIRLSELIERFMYSPKS